MIPPYDHVPFAIDDLAYDGEVAVFYLKDLVDIPLGHSTTTGSKGLDRGTSDHHSSSAPSHHSSESGAVPAVQAVFSSANLFDTHPSAAILALSNQPEPAGVVASLTTNVGTSEAPTAPPTKPASSVLAPPSSTLPLPQPCPSHAEDGPTDAPLDPASEDILGPWPN